MSPKAPKMNGRLITSTKNECVEASLKMQSENQHMDIMGMDYFVGTCGLMRRGKKKPSYQQKAHCGLANQQKTFCTTTSQEKAFCKSGQ